MANIHKKLKKIELCGDFAIVHYEKVNVIVDYEAIISTETDYTPTPDWGGFETTTADVELYVSKVELISEKSEVEITDLATVKAFEALIAQEIKEQVEQII